MARRAAEVGVAVAVLAGTVYVLMSDLHIYLKVGLAAYGVGLLALLAAYRTGVTESWPPALWRGIRVGYIAGVVLALITLIVYFAR